MVRNLTPIPQDWEDTQRRVALAKSLPRLGTCLHKDTVSLLQWCAISDDYVDLYERLLIEWKRVQKPDEGFEDALVLAGTGAGLSVDLIHENMK